MLRRCRCHRVDSHPTDDKNASFIHILTDSQTKEYNGESFFLMASTLFIVLEVFPGSTNECKNKCANDSNTERLAHTEKILKDTHLDPPIFSTSIREWCLVVRIHTRCRQTDKRRNGQQIAFSQNQKRCVYLGSRRTPGIFLNHALPHLQGRGMLDPYYSIVPNM
jgi:hypothetical protein